MSAFSVCARVCVNNCVLLIRYDHYQALVIVRISASVFHYYILLYLVWC